MICVALVVIFFVGIGFVGVDELEVVVNGDLPQFFLEVLRRLRLVLVVVQHQLLLVSGSRMCMSVVDSCVGRGVSIVGWWNHVAAGGVRAASSDTHQTCS